MKCWFRNLPFRRKLLILLCTVSVIALTLGVSAMLVYDNYSTQKTLERHLETLALVVGSNSQATLEFSDEHAAVLTLQSLHNETSVETACLYTSDRKLFASYRNKEKSGEPPPTVVSDVGIRTTLDKIEVVKPIRDIDGTIGFLYLQASTRQWKEDIHTKLVIAFVILICALAVATGLAFWLQGIVSQPIVNLAKVARQIETERDYSVQVVYDGTDEVGQLYSAFKGMLSRIIEHEQSLQIAREALEQRVNSRTKELSRTNSELQDEIRLHEQARKELEDTQQKLVEAARLAGMADIASGVLHNVGNVLNSVNVRITLMKDRMSQASAESDDLVSCGSMLNERVDNLNEFLTSDERGRHLPEFVNETAQQLNQHWQQLSADVLQIQDSFSHVRQIVVSHQSMAKFSGVCSKFQISKLFDEALQINETSLIRHGIHVQKEFEYDPIVNSDRHRILQILVNLLSNAKDAIVADSSGPQRIHLKTVKAESGQVKVIVADTGIGIAEEALPRIFQSGFTTKKDGHGFGLHTSALAAQELGGSLQAESPGIGKGTSFILSLPKQISTRLL